MVYSVIGAQDVADKREGKGGGAEGARLNELPAGELSRASNDLIRRTAFDLHNARCHHCPSIVNIHSFQLLAFGLQLRHKNEAMTSVAILPESSAQGGTVYRAVAGERQAVADTAGAALDALTAQLPLEETGTLVVVQNHRPDQYFTAKQQQRLQELMRRWRGARDAGGNPLSKSEQTELEALVNAEVEASGQRAAAALADLGQ